MAGMSSVHSCRCVDVVKEHDGLDTTGHEMGGNIDGIIRLLQLSYNK